MGAVVSSIVSSLSFYKLFVIGTSLEHSCAATSLVQCLIFFLSAIKLFNPTFYFLNRCCNFLYVHIMPNTREFSSLTCVSLISALANDYCGRTVFGGTACIIVADLLSYYPDKLLLRVYYYIKIVYPSKSLSECRFPLIPFQ